MVGESEKSLKNAYKETTTNNKDRARMLIKKLINIFNEQNTPEVRERKSSGCTYFTLLPLELSFFRSDIVDPDPSARRRFVFAPRLCTENPSPMYARFCTRTHTLSLSLFLGKKIKASSLYLMVVVYRWVFIFLYISLSEYIWVYLGNG